MHRRLKNLAKAITSEGNEENMKMNVTGLLKKKTEAYTEIRVLSTSKYISSIFAISEPYST